MTVRSRLGGLIVASLVLGGCALPRFGAPRPASRQAGHTLALWQGTVIAALVVGVIVWSLIIWSIVRYRRRSEDVPNQKPENIPIEILYSIIPILIVAGLFAFTLRTQHETTQVAKRPQLVVDVIGFQWQWQFRYRGEGITVTGDSEGKRPQLVLPVGETVQLNLIAADVNHSFWVPRFLSKRDLIPGVRNRINVNVTELGTFVGRCAEFCGLDHWRMNFEVHAVSKAAYRTWLRDQQGSRQ
ncbi:MAG: cytochrome c oxidase subunit II [Actinomycetota bacterium]|nr:cytochrome c oxidase subunit II [Actinomycetota bacterium]